MNSRDQEGSSGGSGRRLYNPYENLHGSFDYSPVKNVYQVPTAPEFLFQEEAAVQRRSWGENITYYTGSAYLAGAVGGGAVGLVEGLKAREPGDSLKLRTNRVLNATGHAGRKLGNRLGVIGLLYAGLESGIVAARGTDDNLNCVLAGLGTGALFKAAAGPRSAAVAGALGGLAVGAVVAGKQAVKRYVPI
uniref:Mitochondrial import inner membrane translocase subunit TIM23 n=1 Tax=Araucaria cunninghamii TaxID=56994 RepID=A0A0D6QZU5_ARACU